MKPDITKHLSRFDFAMIGNLFPLTEDMVYDIMLDKGDIDEVPIIKNVSSMRTNGKSMKAAARRKKTFHKHEQREKQYKTLGYHVERLSASERGKLREGVGAFPEGQHMNSMYNRNSCEYGMRGYRKESKHITTKQAISMMEHERWLDEQEAIAEYEEAERLFAMDFINDLMCEVKLTDIKLNEEEERLTLLLDWVEKIKESINSKKEYKEHCLKKIEKIKEGLSK